MISLDRSYRTTRRVSKSLRALAHALAPASLPPRSETPKASFVQAYVYQTQLPGFPAAAASEGLPILRLLFLISLLLL